MKMNFALRGFLAVLVLVGLLAVARADILDDYVKRLRADAAGERKETGFMSAGSDFLYGQDYYEAGNSGSAVGYFRDALRKDEGNAFFHYQLGAALWKSSDAGGKAEAEERFAAAFRLQPALRDRFEREFKKPAPRQPAAPARPAAENGAGKAEPEAKPPAVVGPATGAPRAASVQAYIDRLKQSDAARGPETAMLTPGRMALSGIEYYETQAFDSAETAFALALAQDADNPHLNYLMAVALAAQGEVATVPLRRAVAGDPSLQAQFERDAAAARVAWERQVEARKPKTTPAAPEPPPGGALVFGNYVCSETIWNGPNRTPAFRSEYRGYFELKADGTYRWLDDGATGRYRYDAKTGVVTWLSGHFAGGGAPRSTLYRRDGANGLMSIHFSDSLRWNVICEKK